MPAPVLRATALTLLFAMGAPACSEAPASHADAARPADFGAEAGALISDAAPPPADAAPPPADAAPPPADAAPPPADSGPAPCQLTPSGPVQSSADGEVIENLAITATAGDALTVSHANVTVRNVKIQHSGGVGITLQGADDVTIEQVEIEHTAAPPTGANASDAVNNIDCYASARAKISHVKLTRGSSGIYLLQCPDSQLRFIEGHDFRGPFPRGQLVQWNNSDNGLLEDFSVIQPAGSWPEDNVNVYQSQNMVIRRGLVDGNNSPSGVGVIFDGGDSVGLVEDVDAIRMGNGCFSAYAGGDGTIFRRTRCRDNICTDQGRGVPLSNALMWAGQPGLTSLRIEDSAYFASCNGNMVWPKESFAVVALTQVDFALRAPIVNTFCWQ